MTQPTLTARALKATCVLDPAEVAALSAPDGQARTKLIVMCDGKAYNADVAVKSVRKVKSAITTHGAANVAIILQGRLKNTEITECGIVAQVKVQKTDGPHDQQKAKEAAE